ncbi:MurR/RpiR family transcriptional regulator [Virgibacillus halophilus]|uniref:MurR/RpiR family transcriptional regulator n=1 Tax=Tigheibacillus halophilus TaxID=361280 RepID=UPI003628B65E
MEAIYQRIAAQQLSFSKNLLKITSHLYEDPKMFAMQSAAEAGKRMGVSETTVIRFCQKLGYAGYRELQEEIRHELFRKSTLAEFVEPVADDAQRASVKALMAKDINNVQRVLEHLSEDKLAAVVSRLSACDRVLVAGVRSSHALASWFAYALDLVMGKTRLYQPTVDDVLLRVGELTPKSVVVAFSFHRYAADTIHLAKLAKKQGVFVVALTDTPAAPIAAYADMILPIHLQTTSTLDAAPVVMSLAKSIVSAVSLENKEEFQQRVTNFEQLDGNDFFGG